MTFEQALRDVLAKRIIEDAVARGTPIDADKIEEEIANRMHSLASTLLRSYLLGYNDTGQSGEDFYPKSALSE